MAGLFGKVAGMFVEQVPDEAPKAPVPSAPAAPSSGFTVAKGTFSGSLPSTETHPDPQAQAKLESLVERSLPANYKHFMEQYQSLAEVIPDEATRFKAALKTSHTTAEEIAGALDQLVSILDRARADVDRVYQDSLKTTQSQTSQSLKATDDLIASKSAQLKAIQEEIVSLHAKRDNDQQKGQSEEARLQGVNAGFEAAYKQIVQRLHDQKSRLSVIQGKG